ncbi:hypothetical protein AVEN_196504-1 [Araneus ventricosus]|uniref:Uncharacterized protein n=1 Tax=Araneus ventricosus TaxID=182803 RepID=A0A4Y2LPT0_ARAVE|nr:hypothetical protein AVEN_196504-1 [Araneus ventricosus]
MLLQIEDRLSAELNILDCAENKETFLKLILAGINCGFMIMVQGHQASKEVESSYKRSTFSVITNATTAQYIHFSRLDCTKVAGAKTW